MSAFDAPERAPWLRQLPELEPDPALWERVLALRAAARRRRAVGAAAIAATVALTLGVGSRLRVADRPEASLNAGNLQVSELQVQLMSARVAHPDAVARSWRVEAGLARVDRELQAAYDRGADKSELEQLWRSRAELEGALLAAYERPADLVRL